MLIKLGVGILGAVSALTLAMAMAVFHAGFATVEIESHEAPSIYLPPPEAPADSPTRLRRSICRCLWRRSMLRWRLFRRPISRRLAAS